jgi:hypothetical protein
MKSVRHVVLRKGAPLVLICLLTAASNRAQALPTFSDDFESYPDDAAFKAVWNAAPNPATTLAVGMGKGGGNGVITSGGAVAQKNFSPQTLWDAMPIVVEADMWDYSTGAADRNTIGLRGAGAFFEIGEFAVVDSITHLTTLEGYGFRTVYVGGPGDAGGWVDVVPAAARITSTDPTVGYHHLRLEIRGSFTTATFWLSNGNRYSKTVTTTTAAGKTVDNIRIGGPSGISSTGTTIFDNVRDSPEPASILLIAFGGLLLRRRRVA